MSPMLLLVCVLAFYLVWGAVLAIKWQAAAKLQPEVYAKYIAEGTLKPDVAPEAFAGTFMRCEGPRFGLHLFAGALAAPFLVILALNIFNFIWDFVWDRTGQLGWFDVGELPHSLMVVFMYVGVLFGIAWFTMRRYHLAAPGSLRAEIKRLNGES